MSNEPKSIREKCSFFICRDFKPKRKSVLRMADSYGDYSNETGWYGSIECTGCWRRVEYVGTIAEKKSDVERKLRELWHVANSEVEK